MKEFVSINPGSASAQRIYPYPSYRFREHKNQRTVADRQEKLLFKHPFYRTRNYTVADTVLNGRNCCLVSTKPSHLACGAGTFIYLGSSQEQGELKETSRESSNINSHFFVGLSPLMSRASQITCFLIIGHLSITTPLYGTERCLVSYSIDIFFFSRVRRQEIR